ncbi:hypothetical protein SSP35_48_00050 [Streptomyces sp. NBRC 110611]|nr:hypothetical protein SSP35_48_00050 [Streptomyces sp. NBRC 110611]
MTQPVTAAGPAIAGPAAAGRVRQGRRHHPGGHRRTCAASNRARSARDEHRLPAIVNVFNQHPGWACRARELHELLGMPTDEATVNITRSCLGCPTRQDFLTQRGRGRYQKRT